MSQDKGPTKVQGLEPLQIVSMNSAIQEQIMRFMREQSMSAGEKLPSENMLARSLGVSRTALREAMRSMEALGVIESRVGSGWYIREPSFDSVAQALSFSLELNHKTLEGLEQVRVCLECTFIIPAMRLLHPQDVDALEQLTREMERHALAGEGYWEEDYAFHKLLFRRLDNPVLDRLIDFFFTVYRYYQFPNYRYTRETSLATVSEHQRVVSALRQGDEALSRLRLRESLVRLYCYAEGGTTTTVGGCDLNCP